MRIFENKSKKFTKRTKMKGKILEYGVILGDDGLKYSFSYDDIMNLSQKGQHKLENLGVDFIPDNDTAAEIYLLIKENSATENDTENSKITRRKTANEFAKSENLQPNNYENYEKDKGNETYKTNTQTPQFSSEIQKIKRDIYISWGIIAIVLIDLFYIDIPYEVFIVSLIILGLLFLFFKTRAIYWLSKAAKDWNVLNLYLGYMSSYIAFISIYLYNNFKIKMSQNLFYLLVIMIFLLYKYTKKLYSTTQQKCFLYSFYAKLVLVAIELANLSLRRLDEIPLIFNTAVLSLLAFYVLGMIAWIKFKDIVVSEK